MTQDLKIFILKQAEIALCEQSADGSMPAGHNGPYLHPERPLRNTGHWLITWCKCYEWTKQAKYKRAAQKALTYILDPQHRPHQKNVWHRDQSGKDKCNGLIGAAWTIEALCCAHRCLDSEEALDLAEAIYALHEFDSVRKLWKMCEIDGRSLGFDKTFNHQLWFAASAARLALVGCGAARENLNMFLVGLSRNFNIYPDGLIQHRIYFSLRDGVRDRHHFLHFVYKAFKAIQIGVRAVNENMVREHQRDLGYHAFNLHAFAIIKKHFPEHSFFKSDNFLKALEFGRSDAHQKGVEPPNPYSYPYNPVGFEMAVALQKFKPELHVEVLGWVDCQMNFLKTNTNVYADLADDPVTARARIYEAVELF